MATLTYVYAEQMAVLGPLATYAEPHAYDLCDQHSERLSAPRGWEVMRLSTQYVEPPPSTDDLLALADAVREAARPAPARTPAPVRAAAAPTGTAVIDPADPATHRSHPAGTRRRHLRSLPPDDGPA